jgi:hypothetical protein
MFDFGKNAHVKRNRVLITPKACISSAAGGISSRRSLVYHHALGVYIICLKSGGFRLETTAFCYLLFTYFLFSGSYGATR